MEPPWILQKPDVGRFIPAVILLIPDVIPHRKTSNIVTQATVNFYFCEGYVEVEAGEEPWYRCCVSR